MDNEQPCLWRVTLTFEHHDIDELTIENEFSSKPGLQDVINKSYEQATAILRDLGYDLPEIVKVEALKVWGP